MIKSSIIIAKLKRSGLVFQETYFEQIPEICYKSTNSLLEINEAIIVCYKRKYDDYNWILTNKRLFIPSDSTTIVLSDLVKVDFINIIENPNNKMTNNELNLYTKDNSYLVYFEEKTWHVFYSIFSFIVNKFNTK